MSEHDDVDSRIREWIAKREGQGQYRGINYKAIPKPKCAKWSLIPVDRDEVRERVTQTEEALAKLDRKHLETIRLVYVEGPRHHLKSVAAIARWQEMSDKTLHYRLHRALAALADLIDPEVFERADQCA